MPNERFTRGSAVSDGFEVPSVRAELVIILRNVAGGEPVIWRREDDDTDDDDVPGSPRSSVGAWEGDPGHDDLYRWLAMNSPEPYWP
jgi:hypothetical protein